MSKTARPVGGALDAHIDSLIERWPPLPDDSLDRIAALLKARCQGGDVHVFDEDGGDR